MKIGDSVVWIITLFLLGSLGVLVIMHPKSFSTASGAVFGGFNSWGKTLTGSGYKA
jgi:hypothetical protein